MNRVLRSLVLVAAACTTTFLAACSGSDAPQVPTALDATSGTTISAAAGSQVPVVPTVTLKDASGKPIGNVWVHFSVAGGGHVTNDSSKTNGSGVATSGGWTLGTSAGTQTLTATASGGLSVTITAQVAAGPVATLARNIADPQSGVVNTPVPNAPSVRASDQYGNPVAGVAVSFSPINGAGSITGAEKTTDANGVATAGAWTLGTVAGQQLARATAAGVSIPATFSASAAAGAPTKIVILSGNNGTGVTGALLASFSASPTVKVTDAFDNPVPNVPVTFTPAANSGSISSSTVLTSDAGVATTVNWRLGDVATQSLVVTSSLIPGVQVVFNVTASVSAFSITVRFVGDPPSARMQLAVDRAVDKWRSIIVGNSGTSFVTLPAGTAACGRIWTPAVSESVTNVLIFARSDAIDGVNGTLANANSCTVHAGSGLSSVGTMLFDVADFPTGAGPSVDAVVFHEMGHTLGFGTRWASRGVISGAGTNDPIFTGANALTQFALIGGTNYGGRPVPVANTGGAGSADAHWRKSVFGNEVLTQSISPNPPWPVSRVSAAAMQDIGYTVSLTGADPFTLFSSIQSNLFAAPISLGNDIVEVPIYSFDKDGRKKLVQPMKN